MSTLLIVINYLKIILLFASFNIFNAPIVFCNTYLMANCDDFLLVQFVLF